MEPNNTSSDPSPEVERECIRAEEKEGQHIPATTTEPQCGGDSRSSDSSDDGDDEKRFCDVATSPAVLACSPLGHPKDEVVSAMRKAVDKRFVELKKDPKLAFVSCGEEKGSGELPLCFAGTKNEAILEEALILFAESRAHDYTSAAKRYCKFATALKEAGITDLSTMAPDIAHVLSIGCWYISPVPDKDGLPICHCFTKYVDWSKFTVKEFQRCTLWFLWKLAMTFRPLPQTNGVIWAMVCDNLKMNQIKMEFEVWMSKLMSECLPMKVHYMFMVNEPWWFGNMMWPMMKGMLKKKIRKRIVWLGKQDDPKIRQQFFELCYGIRNFEETSPQVVGAVPRQLGGTFVMDPAAYHADLRRIHGVE